MEKLQGVWERHENRFKDVDASLAKTVEIMIGNLKSNAAGFSEYIAKVDSNLAHTVGLLAGNVDDLRYTAEEVRKATEHLHSGNGSSSAR